MPASPIPGGSVPACLQNGTGAPVLFLHGIGSSAVSFTPQLMAIGATCRAIAWDMPGYGESEPLGQMTFPALAQSVLQLMDHLGLFTAHLVGHSIGGMIAQELAATAPERLSSLVLVATTPVFGSRDGSFQESFLKARLGPLDAGQTMAQLADETVAEMFGPDSDPAGVNLARRSMAAIPKTAYRQAVTCLTTFNRRDDLARIAVPTLLVAGERDHNAPLATMRKMAQRIPGSRLEILPGAGHLLTLEQPDAFNRVLLDFMGELQPKV